MNKFNKRVILKNTWAEDGWKLTQKFGMTDYAKQLEKDYQDGKYKHRVYPYIIHNGLDWAGKKRGDPIKATHDGEVLFAGATDRKKARGIFVTLWDLQQDIATISLHMDDIKCRKHNFIKAGDIIGYVGETGWCDGIHCHWGLYLTIDGYIIKNEYGGAIDPQDKKFVKWVK